jgi:hypothetical protein
MELLEELLLHHPHQHQFALHLLQHQFLSQHLHQFLSQHLHLPEMLTEPQQLPLLLLDVHQDLSLLQDAEDVEETSMEEDVHVEDMLSTTREDTMKNTIMKNTTKDAEDAEDAESNRQTATATDGLSKSADLTL